MSKPSEPGGEPGSGPGEPGEPGDGPDDLSGSSGPLDLFGSTEPGQPVPGMDIEWILSVLPHRYPMLLVDRVLEIERRKRLVALKNVTIDEPFFVGHFPGRPVVPGVLLVEGMAQAGGLLVLLEVPPEVRARKLIYFMGIKEAKFRRPVVPGDQVRYEIEVVRFRTVHCLLSGKALVEGQVAAEAVLSSTMVDR